MSIRIGINGFGRIGRNVARIILESNDVELVAINEINPDIENLAYLFKYDSTLGKFDGEVNIVGSDRIEINGHQVVIYCQEDIADASWVHVDVIIDSSGTEHNVESVKKLISETSVKKVVVTHMSPFVDQTIIIGVNEKSYDAEKHNVISSAICDANAIGPIIHHVESKYGIDCGAVTTLHPWLGYQKLVDGPLISQSHPGHYWSDYRLGRASVGALIPKETTAVTALLNVLPDLEGRLDAYSYRVPTHVVSSADISLVLSKDMELEQIVSDLKMLENSVSVVSLNYEPLVSVDFERHEASCLVDMQFVRLIGKRLLKIMVWYDNEWGYSHRAIDVAKLSMGRL